MYTDRRPLALVAIAMAGLCTTGHAAAQRTVDEPHFSYVAPVGWQVGPSRESSFMVACAPPVHGCTPNIVVDEETSKGTIDAYASEAEVSLRKTLSAFRKVRRSSFTTSSGTRGVKLIATYKVGIPLRGVFYLFPGKGDLKLVVCCVAGVEAGAKYDAAWDKAMRTFRAKPLAATAAREQARAPGNGGTNPDVGSATGAPNSLGGARARKQIDDGRCSYTVPADWAIGTVPGKKVDAAFAEAHDGFWANMHAVGMPFTGSLQQASQAIEAGQSTIPGYKLLDRTEFVTTSGIHGQRLTQEYVYEGRTMRCLMFLFPGNDGTYYLVACAALASDGTKYDAAFDEAVKTFRVK